MGKHLKAIEEIVSNGKGFIDPPSSDGATWALLSAVFELAAMHEKQHRELLERLDRLERLAKSR